METESIHCNQYYMIFVNNYTQAVITKGMGLKDQALVKFKEYQLEMEKDTG